MSARNEPTTRMAVLLHADVIGSTVLVQQDERIAHRRITDALNRFSKVISAHGGVAREVRGDALVAEFSRASDAVCAALAFQRSNELANRNFDDEIVPMVRVGIALGEVIFADATVTGAGVVLAQRVEQLAGANEVCITGAVHEALPRRLPLQITSLGENEVKGFDDPVRVYAVRLGEGAELPRPSAVANHGIGGSYRRWIVAASIVVILSFIGSVFWFIDPFAKLRQGIPDDNQVRIADKPSIAVLPFSNTSGDPGQEYFSDGISEDIINDLSTLSSLSVVARNSSFVYKGTAASIPDIARELGVGYVLEGSVRKVSERVRISAQLIDAASGRALWADRYDRRLTDIFELQDEIRSKIVAALSIQIIGDDTGHSSGRLTSSFDAYDQFLRGRRFYNEFTRESLSEAEAAYRQAIQYDPEFARAYGALGNTLCRQLQLEMATADRNERLDEALGYALKAVSLEPDSNQVQWSLGYVHMWRGEYEKAASAVEKAVALAPNFADAYGLLALINNLLGRGDQALRFARKGISLNPGYTWDYPYNIGRGYYNMAEYGKAVEPLLDALARNPNSWNPRLYLAAAYVRLNRMEDAQWEITQLELMNSAITLSGLETIMPMAEGEHRDRFFNDLAQAGLSR